MTQQSKNMFHNSVNQKCITNVHCSLKNSAQLIYHRLRHGDNRLEPDLQVKNQIKWDWGKSARGQHAETQSWPSESKGRDRNITNK